MMELSFELLREAGIRLPGAMGPHLCRNIIGGDWQLHESIAGKDDESDLVKDPAVCGGDL